MMLHNHTRFGDKMFCGSEILSRQTFTNILNLHCDLDLEHSNPISSGQIFTDNLNLYSDLDLEQSNPIFPQDTSAYVAVLSNQVWLQTNQQFNRYNIRNSHILIIYTLTVTFTLNTVSQFFCMTLWLMMLHNHTTFGNKMFSGSENTVRTDIH